MHVFLRSRQGGKVTGQPLSSLQMSIACRAAYADNAGPVSLERLGFLFQEYQLTLEFPCDLVISLNMSE